MKLNKGMQVSERSTNLSLEKSRRALAKRRLSASIIVALPHLTACIQEKKECNKQPPNSDFSLIFIDLLTYDLLDNYTITKFSVES